MGKNRFKESKSFERWLKNSLKDLKLAQLLAKEKGFIDTICYYCHQSVEKALKAYLLFRGIIDFPHTHDLVFLLKQIEQLSGDFKDFENEVEILNRYYIETKYPADLPVDYSYSEAMQAIEMAEEILKFINRKIII